MFDYIRYASPLGPLILAAEGEALTAIVLEGQKYEARHLAGEGLERETPALREARDWLTRYFQGGRPDPAELRLSPKGTDFQRRVWRELLTIPYGATESYGAIARRLGSSARAVGGAVGRNPLLIVVPCHRVLAESGALTGFAAGVENKRRLLDWEKEK